MKKLLFAFIILVGIFFRLWQLNTIPGGLFLDEINMAVDAKSLAQNGVDQYGRHFPFYFEDATDYKLPGYIYMTTFFYFFFGSQILTVHSTSALAGIVSMFLIGYLARQLFPEKKYIHYFAATTLALSPFAIHFSRVGYETNVALCFLLIYCIALLHVLCNMKPKLWIAIGSIAILIADWTYPSPRFIIPIFTFLILLLCFLFRFAEIKRKNIYLSSIFLGIVALTFIPTIIFPFADARQLNLIALEKGQSILMALFLKARAVFDSYIRLWNLEFLFDKGDLFAYRHGTKELGIFLLVYIVPYILGIFWTIKHTTQKNFSIIFLLILALVAGLPSSLSSDVPYGTRVIPMLIPYVIIISLGISVLFAWLQKQTRMVQIGMITFFTIILAYQAGLFSYVYFVDFRATSLAEFPTAPVQLASYITNFRAKDPTTPIYFLSDNTCHLWGNDALQLWYFTNLNNKEMIAWNTVYRDVRYAYTGSPFDAYDRVTIPPFYVKSSNIYLFSGYDAQSKSKKGSVLIRCGFTLPTIDKQHETLTKVIYADDRTKQDPYYVISIKK